MEQKEEIMKLLIITSGKGNLGPAESFLKNREWKVKATSNLKEALIFLVQEQPPFVMVSVDHPNKKVRNLPKVLTQAFPVCVIAFTEDTSAAGFAVLSSSATEYLIYPPITGPAILRTVNKYYKDQQTKGSDGNFVRSSNGSGEGDDGSVIAIRGAGAGFDSSKSQNLLASLLGEDAIGVIPGNRGSDLGSAGGNSTSQSSTTPNISMIPNGGSQTSTPNAPFGSVSSQNTPQAPIGSGGVQNTPSAVQKGPNNRPMSATEEGAGMGQAYSAGGDSDKNAGQGWVPVHKGKKQKNRRYTPEELENLPEATKKDTLISKGSKVALEDVSVKTPHQESVQVGRPAHVACLIIESNRFSGYLITAMGHERKLDKEFLNQIRKRLYKFLKESGEELSDKEHMKLRIRQVPFEDWALEKAEFLRKSIHNGHEVAMAFFPRQDLQGQVGSSAAEEMATIRLSEIMNDTVLEFNAYVYLPKNDKYVLYTPRGAVFYGVQKERLQKQGIQNLHVFKEDLEDVTRYRAQNYLNSKIDEYEEEQEKAASSEQPDPKAQQQPENSGAAPQDTKKDPTKKSA